MTYHCGLGAGMARLGLTPRDAYIVCDGCGRREECLTRDGMPKAWMREVGTPRGWRTVRLENGNGKRVDTCKACRTKDPA